MRLHGYISQGQTGIDAPQRRKPPPLAEAVAKETLQTPLLQLREKRMLESKWKITFHSILSKIQSQLLLQD